MSAGLDYRGLHGSAVAGGLEVVEKDTGESLELSVRAGTGSNTQAATSFGEVNLDRRDQRVCIRNGTAAFIRIRVCPGRGGLRGFATGKA